MPTTPRFLITTADERTWNFDRPVIFLGEWCRIYDRKKIWQDMDAMVAAPYGLGQAKKDEDHVAARIIDDQLFPQLCNALNRFHGRQQSPRFWRIILGHWFRRYINVMLNRVKTIELCLQSHEITGMTTFSTEQYVLAPMGSYAAITAFDDDRWNNVVNARILQLLGVTGCPMDVIHEDVSPNSPCTVRTAAFPLVSEVFKWGYRQIRKIASFMVKDDDAFIISSYLPKKIDLQLTWTLGQFPQFWISQEINLFQAPDRLLRKDLARQIEMQTNSNLEKIIRTMLFEVLPVCYLEGFAELDRITERLPWPSKPRFIFTSNNFDTDELFKLWTAKRVEIGTPYITGQHGNNYGTHRYMAPSIEEATADKFLTWGWSDGLPQHVSAFTLSKVTLGKTVRSNPQGGLLLVELPLYHRTETWDTTAEFTKYFIDQQKFVAQLNTAPKQQLTIRLHSSSNSQKWREELRWQAYDPSIRVVSGTASIKTLVARSRLIVHSYDSTGLLETLSQNIPTLAFWQNELDHLRDSALPHYQLLVDAGIVHFSPESVASKINEVWNDVSKWWAQSKVQNARRQYCARYARVSRTPLRDLITIFEES